ncbi:hypothetical protein [Fibrobacter sp. UWB13]|uniref:DUF7723 family protein n=1 Tax=Fibrobacter sp. UWB13 TaxID=1896204 RepID=UPI000A0DBFBB|nr:hypothetical protein [Fibrobacter sp. UWB13]SMG15584.1 hypothetical protein SAMN05720489_0750 [Fibrobacter sp. UWB13]
MLDVKAIADEADVIISGFAFLIEGEKVKVVDLNNGHGVAVFKKDGTLIETNMDSVEQDIAKGYLSNALEYMDESVYA